jgi:hypothetical protein
VDWDEGVAATSALQRAKKRFFSVIWYQNVRLSFIIIAADRGSFNTNMRRNTALIQLYPRNLHLTSYADKWERPAERSIFTKKLERGGIPPPSLSLLFIPPATHNAT